jgi:hypothetical protein
MICGWIREKFRVQYSTFVFNPIRSRLKFDDEEQFMRNEFYDNYFIPQPPKLDKKQMLEDLKNGAVIEGVELQQSESLRF